MDILTLLESYLDNTYYTEDEEAFQIELLPGLSEEELQALQNRMPNQWLPEAIKALLKFCRGIDFLPMEEVKFDEYEQNAYQGLFPHAITLDGDGFGNYWVVDIDFQGEWKSVYYICHDPPVVVKQAENLKEFISQLHALGKNPETSIINEVHDANSMKIWDHRDAFKDQKEVPASVEVDLTRLPKNYFIANLIDQPVKSGFPLIISREDINVIRPTDSALWVVELQESKGWLKRLFGK